MSILGLDQAGLELGPIMRATVLLLTAPEIVKSNLCLHSSWALAQPQHVHAWTRSSWALAGPHHTPSWFEPPLHSRVLPMEASAKVT